MKIILGCILLFLAAGCASEAGAQSPLMQEHPTPTDSNGNAIGVQSFSQLPSCDLGRMRRILQDEIQGAFEDYQCTSRGANIPDSMLACEHGAAPYFDRILLLDLADIGIVQAVNGYVDLQCASGSCIQMHQLGFDSKNNWNILQTTRMDEISLQTVDSNQQTTNRINQCFAKIREGD